MISVKDTNKNRKEKMNTFNYSYIRHFYKYHIGNGEYWNKLFLTNLIDYISVNNIYWIFTNKEYKTH